MKKLIAGILLAVSVSAGAILFPVKPAAAAPSDIICGNTWYTIPPLGGTLSTPGIFRTGNNETVGIGGGTIIRDPLGTNLDHKWIVAARGFDNGVWYNYAVAQYTVFNGEPGQWPNIPWANLGGTTYQAPHVGVENINGVYSLVVAVIGTDGNSYYRRFTGTNTWSGWTGQVGRSFYDSVGWGSVGDPSGYSRDWLRDYEGSAEYYYEIFVGKGVSQSQPIYRCRFDDISPGH